MVRIDVEYKGDLHTACVHEPSGTRLETDAPRDNEGLGACYSPTDLVATALASCVLTTMGIVARRHDWPLEGATAQVSKHMTEGSPRRISRIEARFELPAGLPAEARTALERAARGCPVHHSLHPEVELDLSFTWR